MLDDLAKTVKAQLYERASSPLLGAFAISWIAWNYRFVLVLLSSMPAAEKFTFIDANIFNSYQAIFLRGTLYPLFTTLALIFIYPIPAKFVYEYWRRRQRDLKEIQQRIDDETPLTREEARELRHETLKARLEFEQELEHRSAEITRLKETIKELQPREKEEVNRTKKQAKLPSQKSTETSTELDDNQVEMLKKVANSATGLAQKGLIASSGNDKILAEYNLGELEARSYVSRNYSSNSQDYVLTATHPGRAYLVNHARGSNKSQTPT